MLCGNILSKSLKYDFEEVDVYKDSESTGIEYLLLNIDGYEGPIDVLLELAKNQKIDITKLSMLELVEQYL